MRYQKAFEAMAAAMVAKVFGSQLGEDINAKRTRIGLTVALNDHGTLLKLLIEKKIISQEEYDEARAVGMEAIAAEYV